jgi:ElaB/YqjD/DUF883 family membrane-anchored ribosome-binding protein
MATSVLTPAQANLELAILNAESEAMSSSDFYAWLKDLGLPDEVAIRLKGVAEITAEVGRRVINVGKMILMKIIEFVKAHPNMAVGIAIGAAIGALVNTVPLIGPLLAPIATMLGVAVGALAGHRLDKAATGQSQNSGIVAIGQDVIEIATAFFKLLIDLFNLTLNGADIQGA